MAKRSQHEKRLIAVAQQAGESRERLDRELSGVRYELNFPLKLRNSFQTQTIVWVGAALLVGIAFAAMPRRKKQPGVKIETAEAQKKGILEAGLAIGALKFAATLLRPVVVGFLSRKLGGFAAKDQWSKRGF